MNVLKIFLNNIKLYAASYYIIYLNSNNFSKFKNFSQSIEIFCHIQNFYNTSLILIIFLFIQKSLLMIYLIKL